jgi:uncharacterized membrane protein YgcG
MIAERGIAIFCAALLTAQTPYTFAQQPQPAGTSQQQPQQTLNNDQLESLVAPIALYPDPILSQILVASTYPLEIVEAARWVKQNSALTGQALISAAAKQPWDASVQALVALPDVLDRLNTNIAWTTDLGNVFLAQQNVTTTTENGQTYIQILPASTQVVYVPQYNPEAVWGAPAYYPYPAIYYPPYSGVIAASAISFGVGIAIGALWGGGGWGWGGWGWNPGWGGRNIIINNNFITNNRFNRVNVGGGNNWVHNPIHRGAVPYNNAAVANRFNAARNNMMSRPTVNQTQQRLNQLGRGGGMPAQGAAGRAMPGLQPGAGRGNLPSQGGANRIAPSVNPGGRGNLAPSQGGANRAAPGFSPGAHPSISPNRGFSPRGFGGGGFHGGGGMRMGGGRRR